MTAEILVIAAAIIIAWLAFTALIKIIKTSASTALFIAAIILVLQIGFGIHSGEVFETIQNLPIIIQELLSNSETPDY